MAQVGHPKHCNWQAIIPPQQSTRCCCHIPSTHSCWTFQLRADIISSRNLMCIQVDSASPSFILFNIYNNVDNGACDLMAGNGYTILNTRGEDTFHLYQKNKMNNSHQLYTSTLNLAWVSKDLAHFVSNFQVTKHLANKSNHYPLVVTLQYASPPPRTCRIKPTRKAKWLNSKVFEALKDLHNAKRQLILLSTKPAQCPQPLCCL